jgi:hypothetical protein
MLPFLLIPFFGPGKEINNKKTAPTGGLICHGELEIYLSKVPPRVLPVIWFFMECTSKNRKKLTLPQKAGIGSCSIEDVFLSLFI